MNVSINLVYPQQIASKSWLNLPEYDLFRRGLEYAATQNNAIPGLAALSPEKIYHLYRAIERGMIRYSK